ASNTASLRREGPVGLRRVLAALWTPRSTLVARGLGLLGCCFGLAGGLLRIAASHLLDADRKRAPFVGAEQGTGAASQSGHRLAIETGKEPVQAIGMFPRFGGHALIAHQQVALTRTVDMVTKEHPQQGGPRDHRREKALYRAVTAPFACPAGDAQHG